MLDGYKTYIVAVAGFLYALGGLVSGQIDPAVAIPMLLAVLGLGSVRNAL